MIGHEREIANRESPRAPTIEFNLADHFAASTAAGPKPSNLALLAPLDIPDGRATRGLVTSSRHTVSAGAMPMAIRVAVRLMVVAVLQMAVNGTATDAQYLRGACLAAAGVRTRAPNQFVHDLSRVPGRFMKFYTLRPACRGSPFGKKR